MRMEKDLSGVFGSETDGPGVQLAAGRKEKIGICSALGYMVGPSPFPPSVSYAEA